LRWIFFAIEENDWILRANLKFPNQPFPDYLRKNFLKSMEQTRRKSKGVYWLLFLATSALLAYGILAHWEYLTLILPFMVTFFAKALDIM
jgi:hypothetical protein